MLPGF